MLPDIASPLTVLVEVRLLQKTSDHALKQIPQKEKHRLKHCGRPMLAAEVVLTEIMMKSELNCCIHSQSSIEFFKM